NEIKVHPVKFASQIFNRVNLVGNIGKPVLTSLLKAKKDDIFVYELSAHQLYNLKKSPHIAVLLNIYPEHLDYYKSFKEYASAKANITKYQTKNDYLIYNSEDSLVAKIAQSSTLRHGSGQEPKKIPIQGKYYELNRAAAEAVAKLFKLPMPEKLKFLPHRLECVGKFKGIKFYNDSLSTVPETAIEALDFLGENVQTMILGGYDRGLDFKKLAQRLSKSQVKTLILFPTTGKRIWQELKELTELRDLRNPSTSEGFRKSLNYHFVDSMEKAIKLAYKHTDKGRICLMSPASPSFGIFKDYAERGDTFKKFVKKYGTR
ncbi:MAG: Mur ligase family protein, partial [bacterium]|nr:Mur ligase family protein [bacterium]